MRSRGRGEIKRRWSRSLLDRRSAMIDEIGGVWVVGLEFDLRSALLWLSGARFEDWALSSSPLSLSVFARESGNGLN